ncbi:MAG: T9SS type A sorting domain-containing protein [Bacteroidetes bacterium]|nr:T9SS type A sorting domain-containing protein [Bacteroidota bacterium]
MIAVRDGKVALANFVTGANVMLYLSADNGTTFTEQTILDAYTHDLNLASYPFDSSFFPAKTYKMLDYSYPDGTGDAHIDAAGKVHLAWGTYQLGYRIVVDTLGAPIRDTVTGKLQRVFFTTDWSLAGIKYWRTGMSAPVTAAVPNASMSDASLMGITGTGVPTTINMGLDVGLTGMPSIGSDAAGNVFIVFQGFKGGDVAANDPATPDDKNPFGHVYAVGSSNGTAWSAPKDIYGTSVVGEDVLYASVADLVDNDLHILVQNDGSPGTWLQQTTHPQNRNYFLYTKVAKSSILTDVRDDEVVTKDFKLGQNYPNPFNPLTHISYTIPSNNLVTLKVFDMLGREVATLVNEVQDAGTHNISFNAKNLASGMYIYTLQAGSFSETKKMMYLK